MSNHTSARENGPIFPFARFRVSALWARVAGKKMSPPRRRLAQTWQSKNLGWCLFYADTGSEKSTKNRAYRRPLAKKAFAKRPRPPRFRSVSVIV